MPITSLYCPCEMGEVPMDHYEKTCLRPPMPLPWIFGILASVIDNPDHPPMKQSASRLAGCPRSAAIEDLLPVPRVDLRRFNANAHGWAAHAWMAQHAPKGWIVEEEARGVLFKGTPWEIEVQGHPDVIRPPRIAPGACGPAAMWILEDYKITSESNQRYVTEVTEKVEWNIQVSVYALLRPDLAISEGAIWGGAAVSARSKVQPWVRVPTRRLTEQEILEARPYEGPATVANHIEDYKRLVEDLAGGMAKEQAIGRMPLRGEMQWRKADGSSKCDYCTQSEVCGALAGRGGGI